MNHDFTEYLSQINNGLPSDDSTIPANVQLEEVWNDQSLPPEGSEDDPRMSHLGGNGMGGHVFLEILQSDDRLVSMRVKAESVDFDSVELYFEMITEFLAIYWDTAANADAGLPNKGFGPHMESNKVLIPVGEYVYFLIEPIGIDSNDGKPDFNHDGNGGLGGSQEISHPIYAVVRPPGGNRNDEVKDYINTDPGLLDVILVPDNYDETGGPGMTAGGQIVDDSRRQKYLNELVESHSKLGAWIRVNDDFSKRKRRVENDNIEIDDPSYYINDVDNVDDFLEDEDALLPLYIKFKGLRPGNVTLTLPNNLRLWKVPNSRCPEGSIEA
ncbi:MAG: hypothetical protein AAGA30_22100, partial [Planctomycetota bacterium]